MPPPLVTRLLLAVAMLVVGSTTAAQRLSPFPAAHPGQPPLVHEKWEVTEGLPVNSIMHVVQTPGVRVGNLADAVFQDRSHRFRRIRELKGTPRRPSCVKRPVVPPITTD